MTSSVTGHDNSLALNDGKAIGKFSREVEKPVNPQYRQSAFLP
jgi:hypothetical protein